MSKLLSNQGAEEAIGSIEHSVFETAKLMEMGLLDKKIFNALFARSMNDWRALLSGFDRGGGKESFTDDELLESFDALLEKGDLLDDANRYDDSPAQPLVDETHTKSLPEPSQ